MREIKFRIKDDITGEWSYGIPQRPVKKTDKACPFRGKDANGLDYFNMFADIKTLCQFTGLYDKNGKEIYEGDNIQYIGYKDGKTNLINFRVCFENLDICLANKSCSYFRIKDIGDDTWELEVIGNVFDNS